MTIPEAQAAIIKAHPTAQLTRVKTALRKAMKTASLEEAKAKVERYAAAGEYDNEAPKHGGPDYSDPTGDEAVQHAQGKADPHFHHYGWRAPKSKWGK